MANNQKLLRKTILDLKNNILKLEEESGGRIMKLRRLYNKMLKGGAGFIPKIFREYFQKFDDLTTFLSNAKLHDKTESLRQYIDKMKTAVSSVGEVISQYSGSSIPQEIKEDLEKEKEKCHGKIKEALESCFSGTEDKTTGYYYTNLIKESDEVDILTKRELWIKKYADLLKPEADKIGTIMKGFRSIVSNKIEGHKSSSDSDSDEKISDHELDHDEFGKTFQKHTSPKAEGSNEASKEEKK